MKRKFEISPKQNEILSVALNYLEANLSDWNEAQIWELNNPSRIILESEIEDVRQCLSQKEP